MPAHRFIQARKELKLDVLGRAVGLDGTSLNFWTVVRKPHPTFDNLMNTPGLRLATAETDDLVWLTVLFEGALRPGRHFKLMEAPTGKAALQLVLEDKADAALIPQGVWTEIKARTEAGGDLDWAHNSGATRRRRWSRSART